MSIFQNIVGNDPVKKQLELLVERKSLPHLLLFCGLEGIGKCLFAKRLAACYVQADASRFQPDVHLFSPEGKTGMHSIASVGRLIDEVNLAPYKSSAKAIIVDDAERMLPISANALLKTLEEPAANTLIIMVSSEPERLLATIVSRSQKIRFCPIGEHDLVQCFVQNHQKSEQEAKIIAAKANGSMAKALRFLQVGQDTMIDGLIGFLSLERRGFHETSRMAQELQKQLDTKRKTHEGALKEQFATNLKELTATQRQQLEQEMEGLLTVSWMRHVSELFYAIQAYFRDLVAYGVGQTLLLSDHKEKIEQAYNRGQMVSLDRVDRLIRQAKLSIERSTSVQHVFESLFLQLS